MIGAPPKPPRTPRKPRKAIPRGRMASRRKAPRKLRKSPLAAAKRRCRAALSEWVRFRDRELPCISCGDFLSHHQAGHYLAAGQYKALEFDDRNLAAQCPSCNGGFGGKVRGNYHEYRVGLIARYGLPYVEAIEARRYDVIKHTVESLDILTATYRAKLAQAKEQAA